MIVTDQTVDIISDFANLEWKPEEREMVKKDLERMVSDIEKLSKLDVEGIEPLSHVFFYENVFREDKVTNESEKEAMLCNAEEIKEGHFVVPKSV